jgi:hypothetical protein
MRVSSWFWLVTICFIAAITAGCEKTGDSKVCPFIV